VSFSYFGFTKPCVHSIAFHSASIADGALALAARAVRDRDLDRLPYRARIVCVDLYHRHT